MSTTDTPPKKPNVIKRTVTRVAKVARFSWKATKSALLLVGATVVIKKLLSTKASITTSSKPTVLMLDFRETILDGFDRQPLLLSDKMISLKEIVDSLDKAAQSPNIAGLVCHIDALRASDLATIQEIRDAVANFAKHKPAEVYFSGGTKEYYLATAFPRIVTVPEGDIYLAGLSSTSLFFKNMLEKIGFVPQTLRRSEYKTAANSLTGTGFDDSHREQVESILSSYMDQIKTDIAKSRCTTPETVGEWIAQGPYTADEALEKRIIDDISFYQKPSNVELQKLSSYARSLDFASPFVSQNVVPSLGPQIGLVEFSGAVMNGRTHNKVIAALQKAREDNSIKAVILRVSSNGGVPTPAEQIRQEISKLQAAGKPVIASLGDVAASGGYWLCSNADVIVANPGTLTGSIGVLLLGGAYGSMLSKLGIEEDSVKWSPNAKYHIPFGYNTWSEEQSALYNKLIDKHYHRFKQVVSEGRKMSMDDVEAIAKGRVYTGVQAKEKGLVDELGGYAKAVAIAREKVGNDRAPIVNLTKESFWSALKSGLSSDMRAVVSAIMHAAALALSQNTLHTSPRIYVKSDVPKID